MMTKVLPKDQFNALLKEALNREENDKVIVLEEEKGVWLDASLSGNRHYSHMVEKCATVSRMLRSLIRPEGVPGLPIIHTLIKALVVPRISYGLPFLNMKQKQYDALNRLVQRPILCAASVPWNVHRAGASSYFALPTVEVLRDYSIVELVSSILRLANVMDVRPSPERHPAYHLVRQSLQSPSSGRCPSIERSPPLSSLTD